MQLHLPQFEAMKYFFKSIFGALKLSSKLGFMQGIIITKVF